VSTINTKLEQYIRGPQPALPESYQRYVQEELRKLEIALQTSYGALTSTGPYIKMPHAMLMSNQDQASAGTTSANLITYNLPVLTKGVQVKNNSQLWFDNPGMYLITFSLQFTNRGNAGAEIEVWAKNTNVNYPLSNTRFDIASRKSESVWAHAVASVSGIFDVQDPNANYLEIAWWSSGADVFIEHYPANTSPTRPEIPSVILTATYVSGL
jgi:hypothetical protein